MDHSWKIQRYARYRNVDTHTTSQNSGEWEHFEANKDNLNLVLKHGGHLVLSQNDTIMESHVMLQARTWIRGVCKGDSLLVICKMKNGNRRFRMQFGREGQRSGIQQSADCVKHLSKYFFIKNASLSDDGKDSSQCEPDMKKTSEEPPKKLSGTVQLSTMTQVLKGDLNAKLPIAYHNCNLPTEDLSTLIKLCLADASFPEFVGKIEKELTNITEEMQT